MNEHSNTASVLSPQSSVLRVATRGSALALRQTELVAAALQARWPGLGIELVTVRTTGDRDQSAPIASLGDGVFVRGVEAELLAGRADIAVHSAKDLPTAEPPGLVLAAFPARGDPRDVLVSRAGGTLADLHSGARLGTASPRRAALARALRPDLDVALIRGNVDTRLHKLNDGEYDALVLAAAGLERLDRAEQVSEYLDPRSWVPAPGQGALAVQCRTGDVAERLLAPMDDAATRAAVTAERAVLRRLGSGCRVPVGAYARPDDGRLALRAILIAPDGRQSVTVDLHGATAEAERLGATAAHDLMENGRELIGGSG